MTLAFRPPTQRVDTQASSLAMPDQRLTAPFHDPAAPGVRAPHKTLCVRAAVLGLPLLATLALGTAALTLFTADGRLSLAEGAVVIFSVLALYWVVLSVATATLGLFWRPTPISRAPHGLSTAILLPMYGEPARATISEAVTLLAGLTRAATAHRFSLHILSDTRCDLAAQTEATLAREVALRHPALLITYRRRAMNTDFKSGNIRDWVRASGAAYPAMLVLDADSVMTPASVILMADALTADPDCALIQSVPRVLPGTTLWQRLQSFASEVYGPTLARGFALWSGPTGTYLGHNALIRTAAFATCAGLPHLSGPAPRGGVILSHDFVEAALLARAGWTVRILPEAVGSYEDTPATLPGYIRRDTRWCQGNMQHLRILGGPGLRGLSRFHLAQGAMAYLSSVWWLLLLALWALPGAWPGGASPSHALLAWVVALLLLAPKLIGIAAHLARHGTARPVTFALWALAEISLSVLLAPALMVHQVRAVLRTVIGVNGGWSPHNATHPCPRTLARFHTPETLLGLALLSLALHGALTLWLLPIAVSLSVAIALSWLVQRDVSRLPNALSPAAKIGLVRPLQVQRHP